jgi:YVTN family beta-propeller protein
MMRRRATLVMVLAAGVGVICSATASASPEIYVASRGSDDVTVVDAATDTVAATVPLPAGSDPQNVAITPDGSHAYVAGSQGRVFVIDTETRAVVAEIPIGPFLSGIAAAPDGGRVYVVSNPSGGDSGALVAIDTQTNAVVGTPVPLGENPNNLAITPDGTRAYVNVSPGVGQVVVVDLATLSVVGAPIAVGNTPRGITAHPDGTRIYSVSNVANDVSVIDVATNTVVDEIESSTNHWLAITPDGTRGVGVFSGVSDNVQASDLTTNQIVGEATTVAGFLDALAIEPNGSRVWLNVETLGGAPDNVTPLDTTTLAPAGAPVVVGTDPFGLAITPNQPPAPEIDLRIKGRKLSVDARGSSDESLAADAVSWEFGDGATAQSLQASHTYRKPKRAQVTLTLDDRQGCTGFVYTGQTALCNGPSVATATTIVAPIKLGKLKRNPGKGTAKLKVKAQGPGKLKLAGKSVRKDSAKVKAGKGGGKLVVRAKGGKLRALERSGAAKLKLKVTYRPQGAEPNTVKKKAKLVLR